MRVIVSIVTTKSTIGGGRPGQSRVLPGGRDFAELLTAPGLGDNSGLLGPLLRAGGPAAKPTDDADARAAARKRQLDMAAAGRIRVTDRVSPATRRSPLRAGGSSNGRNGAHRTLADERPRSGTTSPSGAFDRAPARRRPISQSGGRHGTVVRDPKGRWALLARPGWSLHRRRAHRLASFGNWSRFGS
jgi:hypothetical protein